MKVIIKKIIATIMVLLIVAPSVIAFFNAQREFDIVVGSILSALLVLLGINILYIVWRYM